MNKALERALRRQQEIRDGAAAANRDLTEDETREFNELQAIIDALNDDEQIRSSDSGDAGEPTGGAPPDANERSVEEPTSAGYNAQEAADIAAICRYYGADAGAFFARNLTVEQVRREIMDNQMRESTPISQSVRITDDERDKFTRAAVDGLILKGGGEVKTPAAGANRFRGASMRDVAIECLERFNSNEDYRHMSNEKLLNTLVRDFYNPESAFPAIMDTVAQKSYVEGLTKARVSFDRWVRFGSLPNFKKTTNHEYIMSLGGEMPRVPENGELKAYVPQDVVMPERQLDTHGIQFTMSRKAFIDDDIGLLTSMPRRYGEMSMRTQNNAVYGVLLGKNKIYDGKPLFDESRKNVLKAGTGATLETIQKMIYMIGIQKDEAGNQLALVPDLFIVPFGVGVEVSKLLNTPTFYSAEGTFANPYYNKNFEVVEDVLLNGMVKEGDPLPWFMGMRNEIIQVDYLNGQREATIRRSERPGTLGFVWDVYFDFGVSVLHPQAVCKNPGIALDLGE